MPGDDIVVVKSNGEREPFDVSKLEHSLRKSKVPDSVIEKVVAHVVASLKEGITTHEIYADAYNLLHKLERPLAARYSLKRAIMDLGPSGFPFEQLIAEVLKAEGYTIETDKMIEGVCASHEVDIIAYKGSELLMVEAKFHNSLTINSDLKVALYVKARMDDLKGKDFHFGGVVRQVSEGWLVTNTKFTTSAIKYAECQTLKLIGWNYPMSGNLHDMIDKAKLHPLTSLTMLTQGQKRALLDKKIILCTTIRENPSLLAEIGLKEAAIKEIYGEIDLL